MITAFQLADKTATGPRALLNLFHHNRIRVENMYCDAVVLNCITYERWRGRVNWTSVDRFVRSNRGEILCRNDKKHDGAKQHKNQGGADGSRDELRAEE